MGTFSPTHGLQDECGRDPHWTKHRTCGKVSMSTWLTMAETNDSPSPLSELLLRELFKLTGL